MSTATQPGRLGTGFTLYVVITILVILFGIISIASIGFLFLTLGLVMAIGIGFWSRPWIVAALVSAAAAFSVAYVATAPVRCGISGVKEPGRPPVVREWCTRLLLSDIEGRDSRPSDTALALGIAAAAGSIAGVTGARVARALTRRETEAA